MPAPRSHGKKNVHCAHNWLERASAHASLRTLAVGDGSGRYSVGVRRAAPGEATLDVIDPSLSHVPEEHVELLALDGAPSA